MPHHFREGSTVRWTWGAHTGEGEITQAFARKVSRTINGAKVTREASKDEPAYLIRQDDGGRVLKSASELKAG